MEMKKVIGMLVVMTLPAAAWGQSMDSCMVMAEQHSIAVGIGQKQVERAEALEGTAFNLPATSLTLSQDFTDGGSPDNGLTISQEFALPSVYTARRRQLRAETELERRSLDVARLELFRDVASAYCTLAYQRRRVELLERQDSIYADFLALATARLNGGEAGRLEQLNAERTYQDNRMALLQAQTDMRVAALRLQNLTGQAVTPTPLTALSGPDLTTDATTTAGNGQSQNAVTRYLAQQERVAQTRLQSVRKEALPTFSVGLTGQLLIKGLNPYNIERERFREGDLMAVEVGVSVPLTFGANKARRRAAQAEVETAALQAALAQQQIGQQTLIAREQLARAQEALTYYGQHARERDNEIARTSTAAYRLGETDYVEHTQNLRAAIDTSLAEADAINQYNQALINLLFLQQ